MAKHYDITPDMTPEQAKALLAEYWKDKKPRYTTVQRPPRDFDMNKFRGLFSDIDLLKNCMQIRLNDHENNL